MSSTEVDAVESGLAVEGSVERRFISGLTLERVGWETGAGLEDGEGFATELTAGRAADDSAGADARMQKNNNRLDSLNLRRRALTANHSII